MGIKTLAPVTLVIPYYRQPEMLKAQLASLALSPLWLKVIVVDDGSPPEESAESIINGYCNLHLRGHLQLYRIDVDIPWNREGARNLGTQRCETQYVIHVDTDHVLQGLDCLQDFTPDPGVFYRFPRWRIGKADGTRLKDKIDPDCEYGQIHPHIDSYLVKVSDYWAAGGYNEDFAGVLGGGTDFLRRLEKQCTAALMPAPIRLHVFTSHVARDASDIHCSRDRNAGKKIQRDLAGAKPTSWIRFPWSRIL